MTSLVVILFGILSGVAGKQKSLDQSLNAVVSMSERFSLQMLALLHRSRKSAKHVLSFLSN